jgi:hypothetical protein
MPLLLFLFLLSVGVSPSRAQQPTVDATQKRGGSPNLRVLGHLELDRVRFQTGGVDLEQEMSRPYAYVSKTRGATGLDIVSIQDPAAPKIIYSCRIENVALHATSTGETGKYFKTRGRYYLARGFNFSRGTVQPDLSAVVFDVTGLPDPASVKEVGRIRTPYAPGGFVSVFAYKHSDGRVLLFGTNARIPDGSPPYASVYDMDKFLSGDAASGMIARVPVPDTPLKQPGGYHDIHVQYDSASGQDRLYGAGAGGFYVFDFTRPEAPKLLTSITGISGVQSGHTMIPSPDHRYAVTQMEYQFTPLMIFDLRPGLEGQVPTISRPVGSWIADWRDLAHNFEVRWPYVFVAAYEDGLQVLDVRDPANPKTAGWYHTCACVHQTGSFPGTVFSGAFELDVRNADGLIALTDNGTGFWTFRMDGFDGWNGKPSSAQDWDRGPVGGSRR